MTITQITSVDGSVGVTSPFGPITDLSVSLPPDVDSPSSSGYASLTGPGQTTTPGSLNQNGGLTVNAGTSDPIQLVTNGHNILLQTNPTGGISLKGLGSSGVGVYSDYNIFVALGANPPAFGAGFYPFSLYNGSASGTGALGVTSVNNGITISANAAGTTSQPLLIQNTIGEILLQTTGGGYGVQLTDNGSGGIGLNAQGSGGISINTAGGTVNIGGYGGVNVDSGSITLGQFGSGGAQCIQLVTAAMTGTDGIIIGTDALHAKINFFGSLLPVGQISVTGSRSSGVALSNLLAALHAYGLILNNSTT